MLRSVRRAVEGRRSMPSSQGFTIIELMIALSVLATILLMSTVILIQIGGLYTKGVNSANLQNTARTIVADVSGSLQFSGDKPDKCTLNNNNPNISPDFVNSTACFIPVNDPLNPGYVNPTPYYFMKTDGSTDPTGTSVYAYCIGTTRYSFVLNRELGADQGNNEETPNVLWRDTMTKAGDCVPLDLTQTDPTTTGIYNNTSNSGSGYEMMPPHMRLTRFEIYPIAGDVYSIDIWLAYGDSDLVNTNQLTSSSTDATDPGSSNCSGATGTQYCAVSQITTTVTGRVY